MSSYKQSVLELLIVGDNRRAVGALRGTQAAVGRFVSDSTGSLRAFGRAVFNLQNVVATSAAAMALKSVVSPAIEIESAQTQLEVLLKDTEGAAKLMEDILDFSASTPLQFGQLNAGAKQLLAVGEAAGEVVDTLGMLGDIAMGDAGKLDTVTRAYVKMRAKGRATLEELNMLTEAGIPILDELAKTQGTSTEALFKYISAGKLGFPQVQAAMKQMTAEGGRFNGMMDAMAAKSDGAVSTFRDNWKLARAEIGEGILPAMNVALRELIDDLQRLRESGQLEKWGKEAGEMLEKAYNALKSLAAFLANHKDELMALGRVYLAANILRASHNAVVSLGGALAGLGVKAGKANEQLSGVDAKLAKLNGFTAKATLVVTVAYAGYEAGKWLGDKLGVEDVVRGVTDPDFRNDTFSMPNWRDDWMRNKGGVRENFGGDYHRYIRAQYADNNAKQVWKHNKAVRSQFGSRDEYVQWWVEQSEAAYQRTEAAGKERKRQEEEAAKQKAEEDRLGKIDEERRAAIERHDAKLQAVDDETRRRQFERQLDAVEAGRATPAQRRQLDAWRMRYVKGRDGNYRDKSGNQPSEQVAALMDADEKAARAGNERMRELMAERDQILGEIREREAEKREAAARQAYLDKMDQTIERLKTEHRLRRQRIADLKEEARQLANAVQAAWANVDNGGQGLGAQDRRRARRDAARARREQARNRQWAIDAFKQGARMDQDGVWRDRFGKTFGKKGQARLNAVRAEVLQARNARKVAAQQKQEKEDAKKIKAEEDKRREAVDRMAKVDWNTQHRELMTRLGEIRDNLGNGTGTAGTQPADVAAPSGNGGLESPLVPRVPEPIEPRSNDRETVRLLGAIEKNTRLAAKNITMMGVHGG